MADKPLNHDTGKARRARTGKPHLPLCPPQTGCYHTNASAKAKEAWLTNTMNTHTTEASESDSYRGSEDWKGQNVRGRDGGEGICELAFPPSPEVCADKQADPVERRWGQSLQRWRGSWRHPSSQLGCLHTRSKDEEH